MIRGLLSGVAVGTVFSGAALSVASLLAEQPAGNTPPSQPQVTPPEDIADLNDEQTPAVPQDENTLAEAAVDTTEPADPDEIGQAPTFDTDPVDPPEVIAIEGTIPEPGVSASPDLASAEADPVLPNPQAALPDQPANEDDLTIVTDPAQPTAPDTGDTDFTVEPVAEPEPQAPVEIADIATDAPTIPEVSDPPEPENTSLVDLDNSTPAMPQGDESIAVLRLGQDSAEEDTIEVVEDIPALSAFATVAPSNAAGHPTMSVVMVDDGSVPSALTALETLPFDVTIALNPGMEGIEATYAAYREAGFEVAILSNLPEAATPSDIAINFEAAFSLMPETVALLDIGAGGLPSGPDSVRQAMIDLSRDGRGFVSVSKGLNGYLREAEQAEVPAAVIYRDLDSNGQDARVIRRFLDQAAFRAAQEPGVILLARVRPETISALILWGTTDRAGQVSMTPVSAILLAQE